MVSRPVTLLHPQGSPELEFLFLQVPGEDIEQALDGWRWLGLDGLGLDGLGLDGLGLDGLGLDGLGLDGLGLDGLSPIAVSAFGEIFFSDPNGAIHQLDMIEGRLNRVADSYPDFVAALQQDEARDNLLLAGLVIAAREAGLRPGPGECYDFRLAPVLGGEMSVEQMTTLLFVVKVDIAGQLHEQVKDLPPGTPIGKITIADPS